MGMANMNPPETRNSQNPSTSSIMPPSSSMVANTGMTHASEIVSSTQVRHDDVAADNNLAAIVERIMVQNKVNFALRRPNYTSPLAEYVLQTDAPLRAKIPKFTKFVGDTTESTVEHVARYLIEVEDMSNNENLLMKFFPSSLTKNAFTWFTTLPQNSIHSWNQLERMFHEQFYMGQTKISLKELASVRRKFTEPIDDYLNRFRLLKARCFMQVPEHKLVEMADGGLDYSIRKKLKDHEDSGVEVPNFDDTEIDLAELTQGPPYACKVLAPSNGRNPVEPEKNDRFPKKTYTFVVTKCDKIFDLLVKDGQMIVPPGAKNAIQEGRLKFGDKPRSQMKIDFDPLQVTEAHYIEPEEVNFIEVDADFYMTEVTEDFVHEPVMVKVHEYFEQTPRDGLALRGTEDIEKENVEASDIEEARN
ncbi:uncharacterized protein LOC127121911 [Lathyrus oleraceus]|uniref:uncharacterized protein LOC127121911 n=1 Tax=Pisum sativum TaxID=3888 RepID=UPI0021CECE7E|nr:uncharacterized protein LOC127121911 [Pisum sativum]